jgi:hypothetical protein
LASWRKTPYRLYMSQKVPGSRPRLERAEEVLAVPFQGLSPKVHRLLLRPVQNWELRNLPDLAVREHWLAGEALSSPLLLYLCSPFFGEEEERRTLSFRRPPTLLFPLFSLLLPTFSSERSPLERVLVEDAKEASFPQKERTALPALLYSHLAAQERCSSYLKSSLGKLLPLL